MNIDCTDSEQFYELNRILGLKEEPTDEVINNELTYNENNRNKEYNQRFKPATIANTPNRINSQSIRNQIIRKTTTTPNVNSEREPIIDRSETTTISEISPSTTFPPVNINQFFDLTTRKPFNYPTTITDNTEYTTYFAANHESGTTVPAIDFNEYSNTRIVPDLFEESTKKTEQSKTDEVIDSIKQLQKLYPSSNNDSREKRFLFKADSVKNRQKLFEMLNQ